MKKYVKLIFFSLFFFSMSAMAQEQTPPSRGDRGPREMRQGPGRQMSPQVRAEDMAKELNLTAEEQAKVLVVFQKQDSVFNKFRKEVSRESPDFREKFKALREAQDKELEAAIGPEKFQLWQKKRAERRPPEGNNR